MISLCQILYQTHELHRPASQRRAQLSALKRPSSFITCSLRDGLWVHVRMWTQCGVSAGKKSDITDHKALKRKCKPFHYFISDCATVVGKVGECRWNTAGKEERVVTTVTQRITRQKSVIVYQILSTCRLEKLWGVYSLLLHGGRQMKKHWQLEVHRNVLNHSWATIDQCVPSSSCIMIICITNHRDNY